jgi:hypothetical protein
LRKKINKTIPRIVNTSSCASATAPIRYLSRVRPGSQIPHPPSTQHVRTYTRIHPPPSESARKNSIICVCGWMHTTCHIGYTVHARPITPITHLTCLTCPVCASHAYVYRKKHGKIKSFRKRLAKYSTACYS